MASQVTTRELQFLSGGLLLGVNIGWFAAKKYFEVKYQKLADAEIEEMRESFAVRTQQVKDSFDKAKANWQKPDLADVVDELGYSPAEKKAISEVEAEVEAENTAQEESVNVFETTLDDSWDWDVEKAKRAKLDDGVPFIIHKDEFFEGDEERDMTTLTYYAGDDVLCDERDEVIEPRDHIIGGWHLALFGTGHGSGDPNVLYIRNPRTFCDFEVILSDAKYSEDALGFLEHSFERNRRRQRFDDDE